jgi:hypothetical protein
MKSHADQLRQIGALQDKLNARLLKILDAQPRRCRVCGCTEDKACINEAGQPCHWIAADLCSACEGCANCPELSNCRPRQ